MNQKGFTPIPIALGVILIIGIVVGAYYLGTSKSSRPQTQNPVVTSESSQPSITPILSPTPQTSKSLTLQVIRLNTGYGISGMPNPSYPPSIALTIPNNLSDQLSAFGAASQVILGPKGWTGQGSVGADGNISINLYPGGGSSETNPKITIFIASTGTGPALYEAAPYVPWIQTHWQDLGMPVPAPSPKSGLQTTSVTPHLLRYTLPVTQDGMETNGIIFSDAQDHQKDNMWAATRMEVTTLKANYDLAIFLLDYFVQEQSLDKK